MQKRLTYTLAYLLTGGILASCGMPTNPGTGPDPDPVVPSDVSALVIEEVDSPVYDELAKRVKMVPYDGSQKAEDYDVVVIDGDAHTPEAMRDNELIRSAMRSHTWVLAVDANADHKKTGLGGYLLASTRGTSPGYLARITQEPNGHTGTRVLELPTTPEPGNDGLTEAQTSRSGQALSSEGAAQFVSDVLSEIGGDNVHPQQSDPNPPSVPAYVNYYPFYYTQTAPGTLTGAQKANKNGTQSAYLQVNSTFELFLQNSDDAFGDFQWVSVQVDSEANPTNGTGKFVNRAKDEQAWFQDQYQLQVSPISSSKFTSEGHSPVTENGQTTVTSGVDFNVSLNKDGPSASYSYSSSETRNITDWKVDDNSSGATMSWNYRSNSPYDADKSYGCSEVPGKGGNGFASSCYPETPADLSVNTLTTHAQGVWNTSSSGVLQGDYGFVVDSQLRFTDAYCTSDLGEYCNGDSYADQQSIAANKYFEINMSAVIPIAITALTFSEDNPTAGDTVTGTVTLASAAQRDTQIQLTSSSSNATVVDSVTVKQGDTSADFQIQTNSNGIDAGKNTTATIFVNDANEVQGSLTITNVDIEAPSTAPQIDVQNWQSCVGTNGKWVEGFQVRYAVTFVDSEGETGRGPWTDWVNTDGDNPHYALPQLIDIPTDASSTATARNIYRQFIVDYNQNPNSGIQKVGTLNDNTTTTFIDTDPAGTTDLGSTCSN